MNDFDKAMKLSTELSANIEKLTTAVRVLQQTIEYWGIEEDEVPALLKRQAH